MAPGSRAALKEWAAIEQVLGSGESVLMVRKGGVWERREGFEVEHREFWLLPTEYHQNPGELDPRFAWALDAARLAAPGLDDVRLEHYAVVTDAFRVESLPALDALDGLHALTRETVHSRFAYRNRPYLHLLVARVHRLPAPRLVANTLGYEGCISWVELDEPAPTTGALPVLDAATFAARRAEAVARLGEVGVTRV